MAGTPTPDVKPIVGAAPWMRLRVGDWRLPYRPPAEGVLVARSVSRRDLVRAVRSLAS